MTKRSSMIFEDPTERRWKITLGVFIALVAVGLFIFGVALYGLFTNPALPSIQKKAENHVAAVAVQTQIQKQDVATKRPVMTRAPRPIDIKKSSTFQPSPSETSVDMLAYARDRKMLATGFFVQNDAASVTSFKLHKQHLDLVFPDWFTITTGACSVNEQIDPDMEKLLRDSDVKIVPRISNVLNGEWKTVEMQKILHNAEMRSCVAGVLADFADKNSVPGLNLDIEALDPADSEVYLEFVQELVTKLHAKNKFLTVDVPVSNTVFDKEYLGKIADAVVLMAYDEHFAGGEPGPIASQDWFTNAVEESAKQISPSKLLIALGNYGYDWDTQTAAVANSLTFNESMALARDVDAQPELSKQTRNMTFTYADTQNHSHQVWFLNAVTVWNEEVVLKKQNILGFSLWRLGSEDPTIWHILNRTDVTSDVLATSKSLTSIDYKSEGELLKIDESPTDGTVSLTKDDDGTIDYAQYSTLPTGYLLERVGNPIADKTLILTFDDGPDPVWTPQIFDVLKKNHTPATFFVVGDQAQKNPEILEDMHNDGFTIGNHTYLHPDLSTISDSRLRLEINSTQRVIESAFGSQTMLFRAPYDTDSSPSTAEQLNPLKTVSQLGYIIAGANIDSNDWKREGVDKIVNTVLAQVQNKNNHVIVMHDAGGDRSETVKALAILIPKLQAAGYIFAPLQQAAGLTSPVNPPLGQREWLIVQMTTIVSAIRRWGWFIIVWLFFLTTAISILRILFLGGFVIHSAKKGSKYKKGITPAFVSVIVPAYNEEKTIAKTIDSILSSTYQTFEILVVDDGSTDATASVVESYAKNDKRIHLLSKPNGGKSSALNLGFEKAKSEIIVTIDADTMFFPNTLLELVKPFGDASVDAVCGNVEVGNVHNLLTGFQALEYITTQNFDRRAFESLNCISVVPGAAGAWRRDKVLSLGGYTNDTLTEDADMTLRLLRAGGKIVYPPEAKAITEAPETIAALAKQRFRWSYGTFQCLEKHKDAFFHGPLGWIALPNMFLFQIVFPVLSPLGDLVFLLSIIRGDMKAIAAGYILFLLMDVCGSLLAFTLERRPKKLMWLILIQRFFYRQFMYVITYQSIIAMLRGRHHGWNKLARTGSVK